MLGKNRIKENEEGEWGDIVNAIHDWVCLINPESEIICSNIVGGDYFGLPKAKMTGLKCCELVHGTDKPHTQCPLPKMLVSGKREHAEIRTQNGRWVMVTVDPIFDNEGKIIKAVHILRDITDRIAEQFEREQLILELQKANAKLDTLGGLIPICSICKKIRDDQGYWNQLEKFIKKYADVDFSHGICPDCVREHYPGMKIYND